MKLTHFKTSTDLRHLLEQNHFTASELQLGIDASPGLAMLLAP